VPPPLQLPIGLAYDDALSLLSQWNMDRALFSDSPTAVDRKRGHRLGVKRLHEISVWPTRGDASSYSRLNLGESDAVVAAVKGGGICGRRDRSVATSCRGITYSD